MIKLECKFILQQNLYHMTKSIKGVIKIGNIQQDLENLLKCYIISSRSARSSVGDIVTIRALVLPPRVQITEVLNKIKFLCSVFN